MRQILIAAAVLFASAGVACADDIMASSYGNTTIATGGMFETRTHYSADHTFTMTVPAANAAFKGTWALSADGASVCRTFETPPTGVTNPLCTPAAAHKVGDTWTIQTPAGTRTVTLVAGIK